MNILTRKELKEMQENQEDFLLIDVLSEDSFSEAHIPGSCNAPVSEPGFLQKVAAMTGAQGKSRRIVTYCGGFHCSASKGAAHQLITAGYTNVSAYEGGLEDWTDADYPVAVGENFKSCEEHCS